MTNYFESLTFSYRQLTKRSYVDIFVCMTDIENLVRELSLWKSHVIHDSSCWLWDLASIYSMWNVRQNSSFILAFQCFPSNIKNSSKKSDNPIVSHIADGNLNVFKSPSRLSVVMTGWPPSSATHTFYKFTKMNHWEPYINMHIVLINIHGNYLLFSM